MSGVFVKMAQALAPTHEPFFVSISGRVDSVLSRENVPPATTMNLEKYVTHNLGEIGKTPQFVKLQEKYSARQLREIYWQDFALRRANENDLASAYNKHLQKKTLAYIAAWLEILAKHKPGLVLSWDGTSLYDTTAFEACRTTRTPMLFCNGMGPVISLNPIKVWVYWDSTNMLDSWVEKKFFDEKPTLEERERAEKYIDEIAGKKQVRGGRPRRILTFKNVRKYLRFVLEYVTKEEHGSYHNPVRLAKARLQQMLRPRLVEKFYAKEPIEELLKKKFVFFALQTPDDAQLNSRAPQFEEQNKLSLKLADSLPAGTLLYVKEHPMGIGLYPPSWFEKIAACPQIRLIPPTVSSHDLMDKALCTVTINSTVGWESIFHCKRPVVLANPFYAGFGLSFDYTGRGTSELAGLIRKAIAAKPIPRETLVRFINAVLKSQRPFAFYKPENGSFAFDYSERTAKGVALALKDAFERKFRKKFELPSWEKEMQADSAKQEF